MPNGATKINRREMMLQRVPPDLYGLTGRPTNAFCVELAASHGATIGMCHAEALFTSLPRRHGPNVPHIAFPPPRSGQCHGGFRIGLHPAVGVWPGTLESGSMRRM